MEIYRRPGGEYKSTAAVVFPKFIYLLAEEAFGILILREI